ncbi:MULTISPECIES: beta-ketoacyl-ACP synthase I [unclassified Anaerobiospirillum]|uniref:beta-ketoacyl-ACP synthase I n=1 Tax=unclassified Anaerobiospirillum TaxID=2647410 RepID=UPI001FF16774|nr:MULTISPECIES: beta-ketoacyl-ACP synthase I [unclassified Anaerobiospirillum]MCK0534363.1 beta-ketoacyl-ACP synthase I [Anaerobiospirillum sp. NML120511]MCK0539683.1 beta-ketoacyl-ACP synthase I [Anaerobiospirillum sp. NML02-A-032]
MRKAVITGLGIVASIGTGKEAVLESLRQGRSGIVREEEFAAMGMRSQVAGMVNIDFKDYIDRRDLRFMGEAAAYSYIAMKEAIADAGLEDSDVSNERTGLIVGSGGGSTKATVESADILRSKGVKKIGPYAVTKTMSSTTSACLATPFKIKGASFSLSSACATSAHCIQAACDEIMLGRHDIVFAGGGEAADWTIASLFDAMGALSCGYNDVPATASRAYDANRDGFVIAAGGGIVVVESEEHARARGARIYAEIVGCGATSDGAEMVAPSGEGAVRCMKRALATCDTPVDYINTHGTSTVLGDNKELEAIREVFGDKCPAISSTKSMSGHALGAAGVNEAIFSLLMLENGFIAPSINISEMDEYAKGFDIVTSTRDAQLRTIMSNSFGFGGTNATLILRKYQD